MQNSLNALKSKKNDTSDRKKSIKKPKIRVKAKRGITNKENKEKKETIIEQSSINDKKPLFLYTDKKIFLLLKRTYYMRELDKTEKFVNSERFKEKQIDLTNDEFKRLVSEFNNLLNLQKLYINFEDLFKSLQLQNKIINILKIYIINKIEEK